MTQLRWHSTRDDSTSLSLKFLRAILDFSAKPERFRGREQHLILITSVRSRVSNQKIFKPILSIFYYYKVV
ncbi:MAG: hypothetical protein KKF67_00705, partial [Nanoarchaeota archaeon]|nr:hypothetical protein [Nanoarchaeota archaeon]